MNRLSVQNTPWASQSYEIAAFVFPGQGAFNLRNIREFHQRSQVFQDLLSTAEMISHNENFPNPSALLADDSSGSMFAQNLLLFCYQVALFREFSDKLIAPRFLTSHSFGEYAAFCASGILDFPDAYRIVALREASSPPLHAEGSLIAVAAGSADIDLSKFSRPLYLANRNSSKQTVFAVAKKDLKLVLRELRAARLPAKELSSVARPYHSPLMNTARQTFRDNLDKIRFKISPSCIPLISSVTGEMIPERTSFSRDQLIEHLTRQLTNEVNFIHQIEVLSGLGVDGFIELDIHEMVAPFIRDILPPRKTPVFTIGSYLSEEKRDTHVSTFKVSDLKVFEMVSRFISQITGYKIEEIRLEQKLEEDLRIDSIKKAEVLFRTFQERNIETGANLEVAKIKQVGDIVRLVENLKESAPASEKSPVRFMVKCGQWRKVPRPLGTPNSGNRRPPSKSLKIQDSFLSIFSFGKNRWVLHLTEDVPVENLQRLLSETHQSLEKIRSDGQSLQTLILMGEKTRSFQGLKAFLRSLSLEADSFVIKSIETNRALSDGDIENEFSEMSLREIKYQDGERFSWTLHQPVDALQTQPTPEHIFSIGGTSGILEAFYESMDHKKTSLSVIGRKEASLVEPTLQKFGSKFHRVQYRQADATNWEEIGNAFKNAEKEFGPVDLIIDASGSQFSRFFHQKSIEEIREELDSKILPTLHLEKILALRSQKPRYLKLNSIAASHGNSGQSVYGFANDYACGEDWVTPLHFPPTDSIGMTEEATTLRVVKMLGIDLLPREQLPPLLNTMISSPEGHFILMTPKNEFMLTAQHLPWRWDPTSPGIRRAEDGLFERQIDMETLPFLKGHLMLNQCLIPASLYLGQLYVALKAFHQCLPTIDSYELKNLITLEAGPVNVKTKFTFGENGTTHIKVSSLLENFTLSSSAPKNTMDLGPASSLILSDDMNMADFYSKKFLDLHGAFSNLEWVRATQKGDILGRLAPENPPDDINIESYRMMNIFEACFQVMGASVMWNHHLTVVPALVKNLEWSSEDKGPVEYILVKELRQVGDSRWAAIAEGLAADGSPLFRVQTLEGEVVVVHESRPIRSQDINISPW